MNRSKIIATIFAIILFCLGLLLANLYELNPLIDNTITIAGLIVFLISSFCFYRSKKIILPIITGLFLILVSYGIYFFFRESNAKIASITLLIVFFIAFVVYNIGLFKMIKEFINS